MSPVSTTTAPRMLIRSDVVVMAGGGVLVLLSALAHYLGWNDVLAFVLAAGAVAALASLVGRSVDQIGDRLGAGATGVLQSALGNLPELFVSIFALRAGLVGVVKAALIGSILANLLLVLGICFVVGGLKHGTQKLDSERARTITMLMLLSVVAMTVPSLAQWVHTPAGHHEQTLSMIVSVILLAIFFLSMPGSLKKSGHDEESPEPARWPFAFAIGALTVASAGAAFVSDWFVSALTPAMHSLHISETFAGLVIVAIAGNAIENVVGFQLAARNKADFAFSVVLNSPIQIALVLAPVLVLISQIFGLASLTLVFSPLLVAALLLAVLLTAFIANDGESNWLEGATLIGLYGVIAASFWWG